MPVWVALLRGINVGGRHRLPMAELRAIFDELGLKDAETHIQSGNVVFSSPGKNRSGLEKRITKAIEERHGFAPQVMILSGAELNEAVKKNPFPEGEADPGALHLFFLGKPAESADLDGLESKRSERERFEIRGKVFYLYAPDGLGRSKLAASVERLLGVPVTARNWNTVTRLVEMVSRRA